MAEANHFPDFSKLGSEFYSAWEKNMTTWWDQVLDSPAFLDAMGKNAGSMARMRAGYEEAMDKALEQAHMPSRNDVVRVARICTLLEERLLQMEDLLLKAQDRADHLEKEVIQARIEAAEARLEMRERLARLEERLSGDREAKAGEAKAEPKAEIPNKSRKV